MQVLVLTEAAQAHEFILICYCVISAECRVFLLHRQGGVGISTQRYWVLRYQRY